MTPAEVKEQMDAIHKVARAADKLSEEGEAWRGSRVVDHNNWFRRWMKMKLIELGVVLVALVGLLVLVDRGCKVDMSADPGGATKARCEQDVRTAIGQRARTAREENTSLWVEPPVGSAVYEDPTQYGWFYVPGTLFRHARCLVISPGGWGQNLWGWRDGE